MGWAHEQPPTPAARRELVRRYTQIIKGPGGELMRFLQENGPAVRDRKAGVDVRRRFMSIATLLVDKDAPLPDQIRARLALSSLHLSVFLMLDMDVHQEDLQSAALEVALDMLPPR